MLGDGGLGLVLGVGAAGVLDLSTCGACGAYMWSICIHRLHVGDSCTYGQGPAVASGSSKDGTSEVQKEYNSIQLRHILRMLHPKNERLNGE